MPVPGTLETPSAPVRATAEPLKATLLPKGAKGSARQNYYHYDVAIDGELIVRDSWEPICECARALLARGITGLVRVFEGSKARLTFDIEKAAKLTVTENNRQGPRFTKWHPFPHD